MDVSSFDVNSSAPSDVTSRHTNCPLCSSINIVERYPVSGFTIAECKGCSLVFVRERLTNETLRTYYDLPADAVYDDPSSLESLNFYYKKLKSLVSQTVPAGKILDVGCNHGQLLDVFGDEWDRYGIELSPRLAALARAKYGDNIFEGFLDDYTLSGPGFDVITLLDVLDHCADPISQMRHVNRLLKPGGIVIIKVHNISCLWAKVVKDKFYAIIPPYHLFYFNSTTLQKVLSATGFRTISSKFMSQKLTLKAIFYRLSRGKQDGLYYKLHRLLGMVAIGNIPVEKNFHDLITVIGQKE